MLRTPHPLAAEADASPEILPFLHPARQRSLGARFIRQGWFRALRATIWLRLPRKVRPFLLRSLIAQSNEPLACNATAAEPICVVGILSIPSGIGEAGRLTGRALTALGHNVVSVDISDIVTGASPPSTTPPPVEFGPGTVILHLNPDNLTALLTILGRPRLRGKRIVGYWAWESPRIPDQWIRALCEVDEVWVPSRFVAESVRPFTDKPVRIVHHPVALEPAGTPQRDRFGMGDSFVALAMFSLASCPRKNPVAAVEAFRLAFGDADDRRLIIKVSDVAAASMEMRRLRAAIGNSRNICVEERRMGERERLDLIASADVFLSLHHAEGFGLALAEAMVARTPVIATAWSGNLDFMDEDTALLVPFRLAPAVDPRSRYNPLQHWAEPDIGVAARYLRMLADNPQRFSAMRERAYTKAHELLGLAAFERSVAELFSSGGSHRSLKLLDSFPLERAPVCVSSTSSRSPGR